MKKIKKLLISTAVLTGLFLAFILWTNFSFRVPIKETFTENFKIEKKLLVHNTFRDFYGDGFSIKVFKLDKESKEYFRNPSSIFFENYPLKHNHSNDFEIQKWAKTPQKEDDIIKTEVATMAIEEFRAKRITQKKLIEIDKYLKYTDDLLKTEGSYYAMNFNVKEKVDEVSGIDLFVISPKDGIAVLINRQ